MQPLISTEELAQQLGRDPLCIVDVRWALGKPGAGREQWRSSRIPGAVFLDLDEDLADLSRPGGRHPLPDPEKFAETLQSVGIDSGSQIVAYDGGGGAVAARLWWMLRWIDGPKCQVLDGGFAKWCQEARQIDTGEPGSSTPSTTRITPALQTSLVADAEEAGASSSRALVFDAREPPRYLGKLEPIDPKAGHIPGAINVPFTENLTADQAPILRSAEQLRARFQALGVDEQSKVICYCGSGVTACHNILALEIAGFSNAKNYVGSWSEWCSDPNRPIATGS